MPTPLTLKPWWSGGWVGEWLSRGSPPASPEAHTLEHPLEGTVISNTCTIDEPMQPRGTLTLLFSTVCFSSSSFTKLASLCLQARIVRQRY